MLRVISAHVSLLGQPSRTWGNMRRPMAAVRGKHRTAAVTLAMQQWLNSMSIIKRHGFALLKTLLGQNIICFHILAKKNHHGNKRHGLFKNCFNYHHKSDPTTTKISSKTPPIQKQTTTIQPSSTEPPSKPPSNKYSQIATKPKQLP